MSRSQYDPRVPAELKERQDWFASIITQPIDDESRIRPQAPSGLSIESEAAKYILPSEALKPDERVQIYNQQYWWRLLGVLHEAYPLLTRLFGYHSFNEKIAVPYLQAYPPSFWSLNLLGDTLPQWAEEAYREKDRELVLEAAQLDCAYTLSFFAAEKKPLEEALVEQKAKLQPHLKLFTFQYNLPPFRKEMLKEEPEHWADHPFPKLEKKEPYPFAIYRDSHGDVCWSRLDRNAFLLLQRFEKGESIGGICRYIEKEGGDLAEEASEKLHLWFQEWTARRWLAL